MSFARFMIGCLPLTAGVVVLLRALGVPVDAQLVSIPLMWLGIAILMRVLP